jgi:hypothetical protein
MRYPTAAAAAPADGSPALFQFTYRAIPCRVVAHGTAVTLQADMGILPFTGDGPSLRSTTLAVLDRARRMPGYGIRRKPNHGIELTVALAVDRASPPASILADALGKLAEAKPLIDAVLSLLPAHLRHRSDKSRDAYRMAASGTANTCPGYIRSASRI